MTPPLVRFKVEFAFLFCVPAGGFPLAGHPMSTFFRHQVTASAIPFS